MQGYRGGGDVNSEGDQGGLGPGEQNAEAFPFDRASDAHRFIEERRNVGKVVLVP